MPSVQKLHETFKDRGVAVIGISCNEREGADPAGLMKKKKYSYGLLLEGGEVAKRYQVSGFPTFYVIGPDGKILHRHVGHSEEQAEAAVKVIELHARRN